MPKLVVGALTSAGPMSVTEIMHATGCNRDAVLGVVHSQFIEAAGTRQTKKGMKPTVYRLVQPRPPHPLDRPVNPILEQTIIAQMETSRVIRRLAMQGDADAAHALVKVWQRGDRELKRICERGEA